MNDDSYNDIDDQNFSEKALGALEGIEIVSKSDVRDARDRMWTAAKDAAERIGNEIQGLDGATEKKKLIDEYQSVVNEKFKYTYERDINMPANMIQILKNGKKELTAGQMSPMETVHGIVTGKWEGEAKRSFSRYFLSPFGNAVTNQQAIFEELTVALAAYEGILRAARIDAKNLADKCAAYMEILCAGTKLPSQVSGTLEAFGIALQVVSALGSAVPGAGIALGLASAGAKATAKNHEDKAKKVNSANSAFDFAGHQPDVVLDELIVALDNLKLAMDEEEEYIGKKLRSSVSEIEDLLSSKMPLDKSTILPSEPNDKKADVPDLTAGEKPGKDGFGPS